MMDLGLTVTVDRLLWLVLAVAAFWVHAVNLAEIWHKPPPPETRADVIRDLVVAMFRRSEAIRSGEKAVWICGASYALTAMLPILESTQDAVLFWMWRGGTLVILASLMIEAILARADRIKIDRMLRDLDRPGGAE